MKESNYSKDRLALCALELFSERGFAGTSIRDIAKATGVSLSNIYHYFGNKEGLLLAILEVACGMLLTGLQEVSRQPGTPMERLNRLITKHLELSSVFHKEAKIFFLDEEHLSPEGHRVNQEYQLEVLDIYRRALRELQGTGQVHFKSVTITAFNILGILNWHLRWYHPDGQMSYEEISEEVMSFILHGISGS